MCFDVGSHRDDEVATPSSRDGGGRSMVLCLAVDLLADGSIGIDVVAVVRSWSGSVSLEVPSWRVAESCCRRVSSRRHFIADCSSRSSGDPVGVAAATGIWAVRSRTEKVLWSCAQVVALP